MTARMQAARSYVPYEDLVAAAATENSLPAGAVSALFERWRAMDPWPDAVVLSRLTLPFGFVTNCSSRLARIAAEQSGTRPRFVLSSEEAGRYKPHPEVYREACRRLGSPPERTLFVAGSPYDAEGARQAGLQAWLVRRRADQRLPDTAVPVVASLDRIVTSLAIHARMIDAR